MDLNLHRVMLVLLLYFTCYPIQLVISQSFMIIRSPVNQSTCTGGTVNFTCVVMFTSGSPGPANWFTNDGANDASREPGHSLTDDSNGRSAPANVTTVLIVTNVRISDNGADYVCTQGRFEASDTVYLTVFGPPDDIINISPDTITACSFVVQWSEPFSDPVCGTVWYTVTISTEGGILIITDNTTMTNYNVTGGLNDNTVYHVNVTASNNAGSNGGTTTRIRTNSNGLPSSAPTITVTPLSNTSFTVNWTISDLNYSYTVIWTNINTGMVDNITVPENTNSYTVTGLSVNDNYNVSVAIVGVCGMMTSDPITVYGPPTPPQFNYCISYNDGQPTLKVIAHVIVSTPRSSLSLTFSASYQTGNSNSQSATCSLLSDMQYNCTAKFAVDIIPSVDMIESVNVTVSGPYGSASSLKNVSQGVNGILSVDETEITENSAKLISELPCFSSNLQCVLSNFTMNSMDVNVTNNVSNITGSLMAYSYPTHTINITGLDSGTTYSYCIVATNMTNMMEVGESMCGNFTTIQKMLLHSNEEDNHIFYITAVIAAVVIVIIVVVIVLMYWRCNGRRSRKVDERVSSKLPLSNNPLGNNIAYGDTNYDDKKNASAETRMQENFRNEGTIKDDRIDSTATSINSTTASNVQYTKDTWYDKLASDDDDKIKKSDNGNPVTNERELVPERVELQANDSIKPHPFYQAEEASRAQLEQQPLASAVNQNEIPARSNEESTLLQTATGTTTTTTAMTTTAMTTTGATTATTNSNRDKRPPVTPINFYDPIQQHPPAIPHLNTSSGDKYALPSPKSSRASKQIDTTTPVNKEIPPYATPDKSKKTANQKQLPAYAVPDKSKKKTKYTELDVLPSPTSDDTKPLTDQKVKYTDLDILPSPTSDDTKPLTD